MTRQEIREEIKDRLQKVGIEDFEYESWIFLEWMLGVDRGEYLMDPRKEVPPESCHQLEEMLV